MIVHWVRASFHHWGHLSKPQQAMLRLLVGILLCVVRGQQLGFADEPYRSTRLENGLYQVESDHLRLITDSPINPSILELPIIFEQALPQWGKEYSVAESPWKESRVTAYLMFDRNRFVELKLIPPESNGFRNGYQVEDKLFLLEQPSDYYRRHLFLHEATHWFLWKFFGGNGPPWYSEGHSERMGTHRWDGKNLQLGIVPTNSEEVPYWGRIRVIREELKQGKAPSLREIFAYSGTAHQVDSPYAWSWAAVTFFANHPKYREAFRQLHEPRLDYSNSTTTRLMRLLEADGNLVQTEWDIFCDELDYGYDPERSLVSLTSSLEFSPPLSSQQTMVTAERGWQPTGVRIKTGQTVEIKSTGKVIMQQANLAAGEPTWMSEPQGITLQYEDGHPLGALMAMLVPDKSNLNRDSNERAQLAKVRIGREGRVQATADSRLLLKINDKTSRLLDNSGTYQVEIKVLGAAN